MKKLIRIIKNLHIDKLVFKGYGLGFDNSVPVFVLNAVPEDILDVVIDYQKKDVLFGSIRKIIKPSQFRKEAECEVFGRCGGCDWLHISYPDQLRFKQDIIKEIFQKFQNVNIESIIASSKHFFYRNKSFLPLSERFDQPVIGMFERNSHRVISHKNCLIQPEIFMQISRQFLKYIKLTKTTIYNERTGKGTLRHIGFRISGSSKEILVVVVTKSSKLPFTKQLVRILSENFPQISGIIQNINPDPGNRILSKKEKILFGKDHLFEKIGNLIFRLNYRSFFQVNNGIAEKLYSFIKDNIKENSVVIDAFSGIGTIGLFISNKAKQVFCIENNEQAVIDAEFNAKLNNIKNCMFIRNYVEDEIQVLCSQNQIDTIIFDPPRKGLNEKIINVISENKIGQIIYISCNPSTQVRDVGKFIDLGYQIGKMQPFDMFPQTYHIENVVILKKN